MFLLVANFCQFEGATTSRKNKLKEFFDQIKNLYIHIFTIKKEVTIILKDLNKFPTKVFVFNQMWHSFYG
jgi:hypothetical protein